MMLWATIEPLGPASSVLSLFRSAVAPIIRVMPYAWATEFSLNFNLSRKYEADIERLKSAGYIPKTMSIDVWIYTNDDGNYNAHSLSTSENGCILFIGVSPNGKAWSISKGDTATVEESHNILAHQVLHEASHCILVSKSYVRGMLKDGPPNKNTERFADTYGLAMMMFATQNRNETLAVGKQVFVERMGVAKLNNFSNDDKYNTVTAIVKMYRWLNTAKDIPDAVTAMKMSLLFSGYKQN